MRPLIILLLMLLTIAQPLTAQEDDSPREYRLRVPSAEAYLEVVPHAINQWLEAIPSHYGKSSNEPIVYAILDELRWRYTDRFLFDMPFDLLHDAFDALNYATISGFISPPDLIWVEAMMQAWLNEQADITTDFENVQIPDITVDNVKLVDFTGDGIDEVLLSFGAGTYYGYMVLRQSEAGYIIDIPVWGDWNSPLEAELFTLDLRDVTGDNGAEWLLTRSSGGPGMWIHCGQLRVLTWRDDKVVDVLTGDSSWCEGAGGGYYPHSIGLEIVDNPGAASTILLHTDIRNVWDCQAQNTRVFESEEEAFILKDEFDTFTEDFECTLYHAEKNMLEDDYDAAIPYYEHALDLIADPSPADLRLVRQIYAQARLTIAYALTDRLQKASSLLEVMKAHPVLELDGTLPDMVRAMLEAPLTPMGLCTAAYNVWAEHERASFDYEEDGIGMIVGRVEPFQGMIDNRPPYPEKAGCNLPVLLDERLLSTTFDNNRPIVEQLEELNIAVETAIHFDLNGDGQDEWLIWPVALVHPMLFLADGETYMIFRPEVRRPAEYTEVSTYILPNGKRAIIDWTYLDFAPRNIDLARYDIGSAYCVDDVPSRGDIRLWKLESTELIDFFHAPLCEYRSLTDLIDADGQLLYAAGMNETTGSSNRYTETVYQWDEQQQTYLLPGTIPAAESSLYVYEPPNYYTSQPTDAALFKIASEARGLTLQEDYVDALSLLDDALANHSEDADDLIIDALRYYRALALEALNRPDEALAEYIAIYEAAPDSAWGILAALHLERVED